MAITRIAKKFQSTMKYIPNVIPCKLTNLEVYENLYEYKVDKEYEEDLFREILDCIEAYERVCVIEKKGKNKIIVDDITAFEKWSER